MISLFIQHTFPLKLQVAEKHDKKYINNKKVFSDTILAVSEEFAGLTGGRWLSKIWETEMVDVEMKGREAEREAETEWQEWESERNEGRK